MFGFGSSLGELAGQDIVLWRQAAGIAPSAAQVNFLGRLVRRGRSAMRKSSCPGASAHDVARLGGAPFPDSVRPDVCKLPTHSRTS